MKADKNFSIKVKSKTERRIMEEPELEMISEWNFKKISYALLVLLVLVILPAYYFSSTDNSDSKKVSPLEAKSDNQDIVKQASVDKLMSANTTNSVIQEPVVVEKIISAPATNQTSNLKPAVDVVTETVAEVPENKALVEPQTDQSTIDKSAENTANKQVESVIIEENTKQNAIDLNPNISRAQLAEGINKLEPFGSIELPILVDTSKAYSVTYFTEVTNMQGNTVFHEWLKDGESMYKRKINIRGNRWRISTSKLFPYNSTGQWQVRITTQQGDVLNKIDFSVEKR
ncbi:DUF2914 domain-containing protein [Methyloprofundus sp.]|uniref:DUF2914 domain-containing protein n=1 Tax=Methyloprofundus sp. TaxID=2020875 RepID=UPI003D0B2E7C